ARSPTTGPPTIGPPTIGPPTSGPPTIGLLLGGHLLPWSFDGYAAPVPLPPATPVELLTPLATTAAIAAGYRPLLHPTAAAAPASSPLRLLAPRERARDPCGGRAERAGDIPEEEAWLPGRTYAG